MIGLFMNSAFFDKALHAFSFMLLHSVWQGLLLAVLTGCALLLARKFAPAARYLIMCTLYGVFVCTCLGTFVHGWNNISLAEGIVALQQTGRYPVYQGFYDRITQLAEICSQYNNAIITLWLAVFVFRCRQMFKAVRYMAAIRVNHLQVAGEEWNRRLALLARQLGIRQVVQLFESGMTRVPVVMGHLKPVIYVPLGMLSGLPANQVEAILLHELAHVRRYDYLVNLVQSVVDAVFFFNPGLLWVSYLLKEEREHCCDDVVLAYTGNKKQFIEALIRFKEQAMQQPSLSLAFPGRKSQLIQRVSRIVYGRNNPFSKIEKGFLALSFLICLFVLVSLGGSQWGTVLAGEGTLPKQDKVLVKAQRAQGQPALPGLAQSGKDKAAKEVPQVAAKNGQRRSGKPMPQAAAGVHKEDRTAGAQMNEEQPGMIASLQELAHAASEEQQIDAAAQLIEKEKKEFELASKARLEAAEQDMLRQRKLAGQQRAQAETERVLAEESRKRALVAREQADQMRLQAEKERERSALLRLEADKQRAHADEVRKEAEQARIIAEKERQKATVARKIADEYREKAAADRLHAERQRHEAEQYRLQLDTKATNDQSIPSTSH